MIDYAVTILAQNKEWIFSGIGVFIITGTISIVRWKLSRKNNIEASTKNTSIRQHAGNNSIQIGEAKDIRIEKE